MQHYFCMWLHAEFLCDFLKLRGISFLHSFKLHRLNRRPSGVSTATLLHFSRQSLKWTVGPCECNIMFVCGCMPNFCAIFLNYALLPWWLVPNYVVIPNFRGQAIHKLYTHYNPYFATRWLHKICDDIPINTHIFDVHTLNFKPNCKSSRVKFYGRHPSQLGCTLGSIVQSPSSVKTSGRNTRWRPTSSLPKNFHFGWVNVHVNNFFVCEPQFTVFSSYNVGGVVLDHLLFRYSNSSSV